ncbi:MAG: ribose 5-phosphate isomerase B [Lachnospiraceae bacterium]|nr:ribose 5-phosphate isomerase B [Lachnospiraceae bacterium]
MKVALGSDHGGFDMKEVIAKHLKDRGIEYTDYGCKDKSSCDYPIYGRAAAEAVAKGECDRGIVVCTTGIGISITANKVKGIRCALCSEPLSAKMTRLHNDANMLALGGALIGPNMACDIVDVFLDTPFSNEEKHIRRVSEIEQV